MKKNLIKVVSILLVSVMVMVFATTVNAAENNTTSDLTSTLTSGNNNTTNDTNTNNTANNTNTNNTTNNTNTNNTNSNTNNTSIYNNNTTDLPNTGIADSIPVAMLIVIFGISAVYAYRKVKEYKNI